METPGAEAELAELEALFSGLGGPLDPGNDAALGRAGRFKLAGLGGINEVPVIEGNKRIVLFA